MYVLFIIGYWFFSSINNRSYSFYFSFVRKLCFEDITFWKFLEIRLCFIIY